MNQTKVSAQLIAASLVLITACGTPQNFGVGRNPLGSNIAETGRQGETRRPERVFNGDVERLRALFLHPISQGKLVPGQVADLEIIAIDDQGRLIDPKLLSLEFTSSKPGVITINKEGMLIAITPFQNSMIRVKDLKTGTTTEAEFTVTTDQFKGNPSSVASLQLVMRDQVTPGEGKDAQFEIIARDALGNAIDPARLKLDWSVSDPSLFEIDEHGRVIALTSTGKAQVTVRDPISGRVVTGTVQNLFTTDSTAPSQNNNNAVTDRPEPIPSGNPGTPVQPVSPGQGGDGPLELPPTNTGTPGNPQTLTLTPAVTYLPQGDSAQLTVAITDNQGNPINPNTLNLQWVSQNSAAVPVDQTGTVTANTGSAFSRITVSIPGTSLSASAFVNTLPAQSTGGGGGGGGSSTTPAPGTPSTYSTPLSTSSFKVHITAPSTTSATISSYRITVGNAPGDPVFEVPYSAGTVSVDVPAAANLDPDTTYPYSVVALTAARKPSAVVNAFGTTLNTAFEPTNIIGGSKSFTGIISTPANTVKPLNHASGNALTVGDNSPGEVLTVTFTPTAANFGSVALNPVPALPASVTVSGAGTQGDPLIVSGPKDDVNTALNNFEYTPQNGFVGDATVTMQSSDAQGVVTADDMDTLIFSVNSGTATPPQNLMNTSPTFVNLITAIDTPLALRPLSNSELNVRDENGDTLETRLTPENGTLALTTIPAGLTVNGAGTSADPLVLTGSPFYINAALNGGLTFMPNNGFTGTARITMLSTETVGGASDSDTLDINVVQPSNLFNGSATFPATPQRMSQGNTTTLNGATSKALTVLYPPTSNVRVNLVLLDGAGNNPGNAANGSLALTGAVPGTVTVTNPGPEGAGSLQLVGPVTDVNSLLTAGLLYSPSGNTTGNFRLRMNSIDTNNAALSDSNDIVNLEVSAVPENRFANDPNGFPPMNNPIELGQNTPLTFAGFFNTPLSVVDNDSSTLTVTLQPQTTNGSPDQGRLTRANNAPIPNGLTVTNNNGTTLNPGDTAQIEGSNTNPMVITGSPAAINSFLNNGIVYTPDNGYNGGAKVIMTTTDGGGTDIDEAYINVLSAPENRRNNDPVFTTTPIQAAPGVEVDMGVVANRLSINNYPANNTNIEVTLSVPAGKGTLRINGVGAGNQTTNSVTITDNQSRLITLRGSQSNINTVLQSLRYTPSSAAVASPETVNLTFSSTGGSSGDSGDLIPFAISNPPRNIYNTQDANETDENNSFPSTGNRLDIFASQPLLLNNTLTATQPQVRLDVVDDSDNITVTLTPANTAGNTSAALSLTAAAPNGVGVAGAGTNADPLIIAGPTADVKTALALLSYTPQTGFSGTTSFTMKADDGGPAPDTNTVHLNVVARPLNNFDGNGTFPTANLLVVNNQPNAFQDNPTNATLHELSISSLDSYGPGDTATVRLNIPVGTLGVTLSNNVTISAGSNNSNDLTLSATGNDIPNLNTVLATLTYTPPALNPTDESDTPQSQVLTMTSGPISDTDTLNIFATRVPVNRYGNNASANVNETFANTARVNITEGTSFNFTGANLVQVGSQDTLLQEDSASIRVTLTPSLVGGQNSGTVSAPQPAGGSRTGSGTNASPLVLTGTPAAVNTALASLSFAVNGGVEGNAEIDMTTTDFAGVDANDKILLNLISLPANQVTLNGSTVNTFPGTGNPRNVGLNTTYALDGHNVATASNDRPQLRVNFYQPTDTVTVNLTLSGAPAASTGILTVPATGGVAITDNGTSAVQLVGSQSNVNTALAGLVYASTNTAGTVDLTMTSTNGTLGDNSGDVVRFTVQNTPPVNSLTGTNSGFSNASGNTPLPLRVVSDTTTVEDSIDFGQGDVPALVSAGDLTVTANTWPTLSVADDETSVVTTLIPPNFGILSFRAAIPLVPTGSGTNADPFVLTGSPANINASLAQLRFTPNANVPNNTNGNLTITTVDGAAQTDVDNINILVERPTLPSTFSGSPNPSGSVFRAVYQFGRDKLPEIVVNDITVSAEQIRNGAQIDIIRYNENDPTNAGDTDTDVLRTVTLNAPAAGETVVFNNQTNRATVTVDFSAAGASVLTRPPGNFNGETLNEGIGRIGARLKDNDTNGNGGVDGNSDSSVTAASHPYDYFVFPERAQYAVEDVATSRGRWYLINTSTALATGLGRLSMIFDSTGGLNLQNGLNATSDATAGLAKNPVNGDVYYIDDQGTNRGRLIRWIPSRGIQNNRNGSGSSSDPYLVRGGLTVNNGTGTTYNFNDKPARLVFNATDVGGIKTPTLYASAAFIKNDGTGNLSGFYRLSGFEGGHVSDNDLTAVTEERIRLMIHDGFGGLEELGLNAAFTNSGDMVFEPDTDVTAAANNHMILTTGNKFYVSRLPIPNTGTDDVIMDEIPLTAAIFNALKHDGTPAGAPATDLVGLSIDGEWTSGSRSFLVITRYAPPHDNISRLYRITYTLTPSANPADPATPTTVTLGTATLLNNGNFNGAYPGTLYNPAGPIPLVDITGAHEE